MYACINVRVYLCMSLYGGKSVNIIDCESIWTCQHYCHRSQRSSDDLVPPPSAIINPCVTYLCVGSMQRQPTAVDKQLNLVFTVCLRRDLVCRLPKCLYLDGVIFNFFQTICVILTWYVYVWCRYCNKNLSSYMQIIIHRYFTILACFT